MIKSNKAKQSGFAMIEIVIAILVIVAIGAIGYWRLNASNAETAIVEDESGSSVETVSIPATNLKALASFAPAKSSIPSDAEFIFRNKIMDISFMQWQSHGLAAEGEPGKNVPVPDFIKKYMEYTAGPAGSACRVGTAPDPNRNNQYYPINWAASYSAWVYKQASGKNNLKFCNTVGMANAAKAKGAFYKVSSTSKPKFSDIVIHVDSIENGVVKKASRASISEGSLADRVKNTSGDYVKVAMTLEGNAPKLKAKYDSLGNVTLITNQPDYSSVDEVREMYRPATYWNYYIDTYKMSKL